MKKAIMMMWLIVMLPIVQSIELQDAEEQTTGMFVNAQIPRYPRSTKIDIPGKTLPNSTVEIIINGITARRDTIAGETFLFRNVQLQADNTIVVKAVSSSGETAEQTYQATVDSEPPRMNITLPAFVMSPAATARVTVSEPVNLTVNLQSQRAAPSKVIGLKQTNVDANEVEIEWTASLETDLMQYAVYRDNKRIAIVTRNNYRDFTTAGGTTYNYQVTAINTACVESEKSNILTVTTPSGGAGQTAEEVELTCQKEKEQELQAGTTDVPIQLNVGSNLVDFTATDKAGFSTIVEESITYDTGPPQFIEHNLDKISPTYQPTVKIRGKISEPGAITVYVNNEAVRTRPTNEDGSFEIEINLRRTEGFSPRALNATLQTGVAWTNQVKLEAIDIAGQKTTTPEYRVEYALCGYGNWIDVQFTNPMPDMLTPRLLIEGIQQIGVAFNYSYRGTAQAVINPGTVRVKPLMLSPELADEYDNGRVLVSAPPVRAQRARQPSGAGYIQVNFNPIPNPWELPERNRPPETMPSNATMYEMEERISEHREGDCLLPGFGCMRLFLELEIPFQQISKKQTYDPTVQRTIEQDVTENLVQKSCITFEVGIDRRIPPRYIPERFLQEFSETLGAVIEGIDAVLEPVRTIGQYLFYSCMAGTVLMIIPIALEKWSCDYTAAAGAIEKGGFDMNVAAIGQCDLAYPGDNKQKSRDNCNSCAQAKWNRKKYNDFYSQICDRVMCPAVPSLQYYLKTKGQQKLTDVPIEIPGATIKPQFGPDCAKWVQEKRGGTVNTQGKSPSMFFTSSEIQEIYQNWLKHQGDTVGEKSSSGGVNCAYNHPATAECCGYEYMREWSSGCGVSWPLDTFDEIQESTCLSAQKSNQNSITGLKDAKVQCNNLFNALGGFCTPEGTQPIEPRRVTKFGDAKAESLGLNKMGAESIMYLFIIPQTTGRTQTAGEYDFNLGYVYEQITASASNKPTGTGGIINSNRAWNELDGGKAVADYFKPANIDLYYQNKLDQSFYNGFAAFLCEKAGRTETNCVVGKTVYDDVMAVIGTPDQEYIIKPNSGIINAVRCLCFPTTIAFLQQAKNIMQALQNCVNTILLTGDGNTGICQAALSEYGCDLFYEALACFTQKFATPTPGARLNLGTDTDIIGVLTSAGTDLARSVEGRYGETGTYNAVFIQKKLVHAVCMWAFTGTWEFDVSAMFDQSVESTPTASYGLMYPCNRRFVSFNPATTPSGLTTWVYHFGVGLSAGANVDLQLKLKCSTGRCNPAEGYANGECDCSRIGERTITILPDNIPATLSRGQILNEEVFYTVQGSLGEGNVRYDKAILTYKWEDQGRQQEESVECNIGQTGGGGGMPAFCRFDPPTMTFRCQYGESSTGIRFLGATVDAPHKIPQPVFALDEPLNIALNVRQSFPTPVEQKNIKHLQYEIQNSAGQVVEKSASYKQLRTDGDYSVNINTILDPKAMVKEAWFRPGAGAAQGYQTRTWSSLQSSIAAPGDGGLINNVRILDKNGNVINTPYSMILEFENRAGTETWKIYGASGTAGLTVDPSAGLSGKGAQLPSAEGIMSGTTTTINYGGRPAVGVVVPSAGPAGAAREYFEGSIIIQLSRSPVGLAINEKRQVLIVFQAPTAVRGVCSDPTSKTQPQRFTAAFTSYDSDNYGQVTDQISIDPLTGQDAVVRQEFFAVCANANELTQLEQRAGGQIPATSFAAELRQLLKDALVKEDKHLQQLQQYTITDRTNPQYKEVVDSGVHANLGVEIQKLITTEQDLQTSLLPYIQQTQPQTPRANQLATINNSISLALKTIGDKSVEISNTRNDPTIRGAVNEIVAVLNTLNGAKRTIIQNLETELGVPASAPIPVPGECNVPADCTAKYGPAAPGLAYICTDELCQSAPTFSLEKKILNDAKLGLSYNQLIQITGGQIPMTCTAQNLPPGLSIKAESIVIGWYCIISGTPTGEKGAYPMRVTVTDSTGKTASEEYQLPVILSQCAQQNGDCATVSECRSAGGRAGQRLDCSQDQICCLQ